MFDVQVIDYGPRCIAMCNDTMYEGNSSSLDAFYREEMIMVYSAPKPCELRILDPNRATPVLQIKSDYLAISPQFFNKGYELHCAHGKVAELTLEYFHKQFGRMPKNMLQ